MQNTIDHALKMNDINNIACHEVATIIKRELIRLIGSEWAQEIGDDSASTLARDIKCKLRVRWKNIR